MARFKVGDTVWYACCQHKEIWIQCPTCFGKKEVTLILGNDERVILPCDGCSSGYNPPSGQIREYDYVVAPVQVCVSGLSSDVDGTKETVRYKSAGGHSYDDADLFLTKEEAKEAAEAKKRELDEVQRTRAENIKHNVHRKFSWNAHYHMREAKRCREKALRHDEKAKLCEERAKEPTEEQA